MEKYLSLRWDLMYLAVPRPPLLSCSDLLKRLSGRVAVPRRAACFPFSAETGWCRAGPKGFAAALMAAVSLRVQLGPCTELLLPGEAPPPPQSPQVLDPGRVLAPGTVARAFLSSSLRGYS